MQAETSVADLLAKAEEARKNKDDDAAIAAYRQVLDADDMQIGAYDGLMKSYRRQKLYKKELAVIDAALKVYRKYYKQHSGKHNKKVDVLSAKLNKSLGLVDKSGEAVYQPEPIAHWEKRKATVMKKIGKQEQRGKHNAPSADR